jgi:hypothetical protein
MGRAWASLHVDATLRSLLLLSMGNLELHFFFIEFWLTIGNLELHFFPSKEFPMLTMGNLELHFFLHRILAHHGQFGAALFSSNFGSP